MASHHPEHALSHRASSSDDAGEPCSPTDALARDRSLLQTADILAQARAGSAQAREDLFRRYHAKLARFLHMRLPSSARGMLDTDDIVQEVYASALSTLDRFEYRGIGSFWAYLRRIGINHLRQIARRPSNDGRMEPALDASAPDPAAPDSGPISKLMKKEQLEAFEKALERISEAGRDALLMRLELDLGYEAIAAECGFPSADAARMAVCRAMGRVAEEMSRGGHGE